MPKGAGDVRGKNLSINEAAKNKISKIISDIKNQGFSKESPFIIGSVEKRMTDFSKENGIKIAGTDIYMTPQKIMHSLRDSKVNKNLTVSEKDLKNFPFDRFKMRLYYDTASKNFTYTDGKNKFIINPNYQLKLQSGKTVVVNYITATKMRDNNEFNMNKYVEVIRKKR